MTFKTYSFILLSLLLFCHCKKEDTIPSPSKENLANIESCQNDLLKDSTEIAQNLVGDWKLVGYGCGHCVPHEAPKATLKLTQNKGTLDLSNAGEDDIILEFDWTLERFNLGTEDVGFRFKSEPNHYALHMNFFCEKYMYFDHRPFDGLLMLYEKQ